MPLTKDGEECQTCGYCSRVGPHFPHDCECDWRTTGHLDPETGKHRGGVK